MTFDQAVQYVTSFNNLPRGTLLKYDSPKKWYRDYRIRMNHLLALLGHPEKKIPHYIHVAGTSGKGSTVTYFESILRAACIRTGMMLSPFPSHIREQWHIAGRPVSSTDFARVVTRVAPIIDTFFTEDVRHRLSLFDLETLIGLVLFAEAGVDWVVIEVGLGGRYDSTNILPHKDLAVITSIGRDHMEYLGNTTEKIAYEKAGIIIPNSRVLTGVTDSRVHAVIAKECRKQQAELVSTRGRDAQIGEVSLAGTAFTYKAHEYHIRALGNHQVHNAALCIDGARLLGIPERAIVRGLKQASQPIRMEVVSQSPCIILDGAHNLDKMKSTIATFQDMHRLEQWKGVHLIIGFSHDKDWKTLVRRLSVLGPVSVACTRNTINPFRKVASPGEVAAYTQQVLPGATVQLFLDPAAALAWSRTQMRNHDILLCTGSIFLSGELRPLLTKPLV